MHGKRKRGKNESKAVREKDREVGRRKRGPRRFRVTVREEARLRDEEVAN